MDLLERARALASSPLFESLAPAALIRLAERARWHELAAGEQRTTDDTVWVVARGAFTVGVPGDPSRAITAAAGNVIGMLRAVSDATPPVELSATEPSAVVALAVDDVRDVLEEDTAALAALADRLASHLAELA
jgi:CRP-like cAMP-binding protein